MSSNILSVFNPPPARDLPSDGEACLPCTVMQSCVAIGGGLWMNSNLPFKGPDGKIDFIKHPLWWQKSIRGVGILLFGLGAYRSGEVATILYDKWQSRK